MKDPGPLPSIRLGGVDRSVPAYLLDKSVWYDSLGMRFNRGRITMYPRKAEFARVEVTSTNPVTGLAAIPTGMVSNHHVVAFAHGFVSRITSNGGTGVKLGGDNSFNVKGAMDRWSLRQYGGFVYFTNLSNPVAYTDGTLVKKFSTLVPAARYVEIFYDHLVVANVFWQGCRFFNRIMWSDLLNVGKWVPARTNEADHFDCVQSSFLGSGTPGQATGLARLSLGGNTEVLCTYTSDTVYVSKYVGLPKVMRTDPVNGTGCDFLYGVVSTETIHFFPSLRDREFYSFDGSSVKRVGGKIAEYFFNDLSTIEAQRQLTWGFYDRANNEVAWVYPSTSAFNKTDKVVVLNIKTGAWYPIAAENLWSFLDCAGFDVPTSDLTGFNWGSITGTAERPAGGSPKRLWGSGNGVVLQDTTVIDATTVQTQVPFLETPDLTYGDLASVKEVESMVIHATCPDGIYLNVAKRAQLDDAVVYDLQNQVWLPTLPQGRLTFPRTAGRIIRYKFVPKLPSGGLYNPPAYSLNLSTAISSKRFAEKSFIPTTNGRFYPPKIGTYLVIVVGAGGGGGARAILTTNTFTWTDTSSLIAVRDVKFVKIRKKWRGTSTTFTLNDYFVADGVDTSGAYKVYIPDAGGADPHTYAGMSTTTRQALYDAAAAYAKEQVRLAGNTFNGYLMVRFSKVASGGARGFLWTTWVSGSKALTTMPTTVWQMEVDVVYLTSAQRELQSGGGGSSCYVVGHLTFNSLAEYAEYQIGRCANHTTDGSNSTGATGTPSLLFSTGLGFSVQASGGSGAQPTGGDIIDGFGGVSFITPGTRWVTILVQNGSNATREVPSSGAPITTPARGGAAVNDIAVRHIGATVKQRGLKYGGGGCGQREDFSTDLSGTNGADGYVEFRWVDAPTAIPPGIKIAQTAVRAKVSMDTVPNAVAGTLPGSGSQIYTVRVRGVVEPKTYVGGSNLGSFAVKDPTPPNTASVVAVLSVIGGGTYYLNRGNGAQQTCLDISDTFQITELGGAFVSLYLVPNSGLDMYEPRDPNGVPLFPSTEVPAYKPQWITVDISLPGDNTLLASFEFESFVDNLYNGDAEK